MLKRVVNFIRYNKEKRLTVKAYLYAAYFRICILIDNRHKKKKLEGMLGERGKESSYEMNPEELHMAKVVAAHVNRIATHTPWESKCMVRAMTAQKLLEEMKIETTLYLGVGKNRDGSMRAHAWLRYGKYCVTGEGSGECRVVAAFKK